MKWSKFMTEGTTVDSRTYESFKNEVLNSHNIVRKTVALSDIDIVSDKIIKYKDVDFKLSETGFKSLVRILGLTSGAVMKITDALGNNISTQLLSMMKKSAKNSNESVCIIFNKKQFAITSFTKEATGVLSNEAFFSLFENTMNNNPNLDIRNMSISPEGNVDISVLNNNWEFDLKGFNDEYFKSGLTFLNSSDLTSVNAFNERLSCLNGMIADNLEGTSIYLSRNSGNVDEFFDVVTNLKDLNGFESIFKSRIRSMMNTQASLDELTNVYNSFKYHTTNYDDKFVKSQLESFIPLNETKHAFRKENISLSKLSINEKKRIRTGITVWDLVNNMTDLSSHPEKYGLKLRNGSNSISDLQRASGDLAFKKLYDLGSPVRQLF